MRIIMKYRVASPQFKTVVTDPTYAAVGNFTLFIVKMKMNNRIDSK